MATIASLPPETLSSILELASEHDLRGHDDERREALKTLAAASLVAQRWREPAQAIMWLRLGVSTSVAERILASPVCGLYRTAEVAFVDVAADDGTIEKLLGRLRGVGSLTFESRQSGRSGVGWLSLPSLRDLTNLKINASFTRTVPANLQPSFHLQTLTLGPNAHSTSLNHTLLSSSSSSLLSLSHFNLPTSVRSGLVASLPLVASHLATLFFLEPIPAVIPLVPPFASLTTLTLTLGNYPRSVTLLVRHLDSQVLVAFAYTVKRDTWQGLGEIGFTTMTRSFWCKKTRWRAFLALCRERGIRAVDLPR